MKTEAIMIKYDGIDIVYDEEANRWVYELRGCERFAGSLQAAKDAINAPEPTKKKSFTRIKGYMFQRWSDDAILPVEVTSVAESRFGTEVWIMKGKTREKVRADAVYQATPENLVLVGEWKRAREEEKAATKRKDGLVQRMKTVVSALPTKD